MHICMYVYEIEIYCSTPTAVFLLPKVKSEEPVVKDKYDFKVVNLPNGMLYHVEGVHTFPLSVTTCL